MTEGPRHPPACDAPRRRAGCENPPALTGEVAPGGSLAVACTPAVRLRLRVLTGKHLGLVDERVGYAQQHAGCSQHER